jgi:hypothetical protein
VTGYSLLDLVGIYDVLVLVELVYRVNGGRSYETGRSEARWETRGALLGLVLVTGWADTPRTHRGELLKDESGETRAARSHLSSKEVLGDGRSYPPRDRTERTAAEATEGLSSSVGGTGIVTRLASLSSELSRLNFNAFLSSCASSLVISSPL